MLITVHAGAEPVALVTTTPADTQVAAHLRSTLVSDVRARTLPPRLVDADVIERSRAWAQPFVVVLDIQNGTVRVFRPATNTALVRQLSPEKAGRSPYAVALVALELLELAGHDDTAETKVVLPDSPSETPPDGRPRRPEPPEPSPALRPQPDDVDLALHAGAQLFAAIDGDVTLWQPWIGADLQFQQDDDVWLTLGVRAAAFGSDSRTDPTDAEYQRTEAGARVGILWRRHAWSFGGAVEGGATWISVHAQLQNATADDDRAALWLGAVATGRLELFAGFGLIADAGLSATPATKRFFSRGDLTLDEGRISLISRLGLGWVGL